LKQYKRYCKTLQLKDDPALIEEYKKLHAVDKAWPEITQGMKDIGIIDMEIYIDGTTLFMIMETEKDFKHEEAMARLSTMPRQSEWEVRVSEFQKTSVTSAAKEKWRLIERIYKMDQDKEFSVEEGYIQRTKI
jgi:L-rhamnose mutarotase